MKLIVTRPEEDAGSVAAKLAKLGHDAVMLPLLKIVPRAQIHIPAQNWQAICITSANAPRACPATPTLRKVPTLAVGPQSMHAALQNGYEPVSAHGGDVMGLRNYITSHLQAKAGPILYLSGAETSGDLAGKLRDQDFTVHREIVYDAVPVVHADMARQLGDADGILLYSPRTTRLWLHAVRDSHLFGRITTLHHYCLSPNVAALLPGNVPRTIAPTPDERALLTLLEQTPEAD